MSLENLSYDVFFLILKDLSGGLGYSEYIGIVKALRLTSRSLNIFATDALFDSLHLYASDPNSWMKMKKILQHPILVQHVRVLAVMRDFDFDFDVRDGLDLASMPNLKEIVVQMPSGVSKIHFQRQCSANNTGKAEHPILICLDRFYEEENEWANFVSDLANGAVVHGYQLDLLRVNLAKHLDRPFWISVLPTIDLRYLHALHFDPSWDWDSEDEQALTSIILPAMRNLPCLVDLRIRQNSSFKDTGDGFVFDFINVLQKYHWPSVRHIKIVELPTALTSLKNFLLLYRGQLRCLAMYGRFPRMTMEDFCKDCGEQSEIYCDDIDDDVFWYRECGQVLQAWIKQKIMPEYFTVGSLLTWHTFLRNAFFS